jgi:hypothetical protein
MSFVNHKVLLATAALSVFAASAPAQDAGKGFLFGAPEASFAVRGGWALATASSDLFSFTTQQLTLSKRDFSSPSGDAELAVRLGDRWELALGAGVAEMNKNSEFRHYIDNFDKPIEQRTGFRRVPITLDIKRYLGSTGRSIGKYVWIPSRLVPYVGVGAGAMFYRFIQEGDFVDYETLDVFHGRFLSDGWTMTEHVRGGVDYSLSPRFVFTTDARFTYARAPLSKDFDGFHRLDLSGLSTTAGLSVRF